MQIPISIYNFTIRGVLLNMVVINDQLKLCHIATKDKVLLNHNSKSEISTNIITRKIFFLHEAIMKVRFPTQNYCKSDDIIRQNLPSKFRGAQNNPVVKH